MLDEVLLFVVELLPILGILAKINFFSGPKGGFLVFVHFPDIIVFNREQNESVWIFFKERLWERSLRLGELAVVGVLYSMNRNNLDIIIIIRNKNLPDLN